MTTNRDDQGFTLIELLIVIVILGIVAAVVVFAVGGMTADAQENGCRHHRRVLGTAVESYFAQHNTHTLADAGGADGYEQTLVDSNFMRETSEVYDLDASGQLVQVTGSICTL